MIKKTIEILQDIVEEGVEVLPESRLVADLGLNSLDLVNAVVMFEDEFDIEIPERSIYDLRTVSDVANCLQELVS